MALKYILTLILIVFTSQIDCYTKEWDSSENNIITEAQRIMKVMKQFDNIKDSKNIEVEDIIDDIQRLIDSLKNLTIIAINKAESKLQPIIEKAKNISTFMIEKSKSSIEVITNRIQKQIDALNESVNGTDIGECIINGEQYIKNLVEDLFTNLEGCITGEVTSMLDLIYDSINKVNGTYHKIEKLIDDKNKCTSFICYTEIIIKIVKAAIELPTELITNVIVAVEQVSTVEVRLTECTSGQISQAISDGNRYLDDTGDCIAQKLQS